MFRLSTFALVALAGALALTNPNVEAHRAAVYSSVAEQTTDSPVLGKIAADVLGNADVVPLTYNNYYLFSTTTLNGKTESVGALSRVWRMQK
jgi:hypothetical protein